jgi:Domain of unknown function (DUF6983)
MAQTYEIPLKSVPQIFTITLNTVVYTVLIQWRDGVGWVLDIGDSQNNPIVSGIPLVTGADLLGQLAYLDINGILFCQTDNDPDAVPTFDNLGVGSHLYFKTP